MDWSKGENLQGVEVYGLTGGVRASITGASLEPPAGAK
jgi:hypothetical protein